MKLGNVGVLGESIQKIKLLYRKNHWDSWRINTATTWNETQTKTPSSESIGVWFACWAIVPKVGAKSRNIIFGIQYSLKMCAITEKLYVCISVYFKFYSNNK